MNDYLRRAMEYLDRAAFGVELWKFPANNPRAQAETEKAATRHVGGGRSIILVPVMPGQQEELYGVEHIEPGLQGVDTLLQVIRQFFEEKMKRVIVGQTLTSEAQSTGMGSGVADAHLATFHDIITYDARNLEETISEQLVKPLQEWNFPQFRNIKLVFTIDTETDNVLEKMNAFRQAYDIGFRIRTVDVATAIGVAEAGPDEAALENPQLAAAKMQISQGMGMQQPMAPQGASPGSPTWQLGEPSPQAGVQGPSNTFPASPIPR
jgi:phage gp29-like protein